MGTPKPTPKNIWTKNFNDGAASIVFSSLSLFIFPYILGIFGFALGIRAVHKNQKKLGNIGIIIGGISLALYFISKFSRSY